MRTRALLLMLVAFAVASPCGARAQTPDPARLTAAKELMKISGVAAQFDEFMPLLTQQMSQSFAALAPDKAGEIREVFTQMTARFFDRKAELIDKIAVIYAETLTAEDITAAIAFYRSPAGMHLVAAQPGIIRRAMVLGQEWGAQIGREMEAEARKELKKRGIEL